MIFHSLTLSLPIQYSVKKSYPRSFILYRAGTSCLSWAGSFLKMQQHGWRCASSFVGGFLLPEDILTQSLLGTLFTWEQDVNIIERSSKLGGYKHKMIPSRLDDYGMVVEISSRRGNDFGQVLSEISPEGLIMNGLFPY